MTESKVLYSNPREGMPRVSIIMPTLNEEKYLIEALESIKNQGDRISYELIVIDGGSTDRTIGIAKKYADLILHEPVKKIGVARNTGAFRARGEYLVCANGDTIYAKGWLKNIIKPFEKRNIVAVTGRILPKDGDIVDKVFANSILHPTAYLLSKVKMHYVDSSSMAMRRDIFLKVGGFDSKLKSGEDTELLKRMKKHGKIVYAKDSLALVSMRRVKKWGKAYYMYFHTTNFLKAHLLDKGHDRYEPIRE
ncbi:MAG: glycosyltransferase [Candidatus Micrarchaeia archaeon]